MLWCRHVPRVLRCVCVLFVNVACVCAAWQASGVGTNPITLRYPMREPKCPSEFLGAVGVGTDTDGAKGRGYHNHLFVQALRDIMHKEPNVEFVEGRVVDVLKTGPGSSHVRGVVWVDKTNTRHEALAPFTVLCDGYYSVLRKVCTVHTSRVACAHACGACYAMQCVCVHLFWLRST